MNIMLARLSSLEDQAYQLAGHPFSLTATDDIAQVTYKTIYFQVDLYNSNEAAGVISHANLFDLFCLFPLYI